MITERTRRIVFERDGERCVVCGSMANLDGPHHCLFRSQYHGKDRDKPWNLVTICIRCHNGIHFIAGYRKVRGFLEALAISRRDGTEEVKKTGTPEEYGL